MKNRRYGLMIVLLFAVSLLLHACGARPDPDSIPDATPLLNFENIPDGTHRGIFTYGGFNYTVDAVAEDGKVAEIIIIANVDNQKSKEAEVVLERVVEAQSLQVDTVSGATSSSRALLKAAENAIRKAKQE